MAVTVQSIVDQAEYTLLDETNVRWSSAELAGYVNDGQLEIVMAKPDANAKVATISQVAGTKQSLPSDGIVLLGVIKNAANGAVRRVSRVDLDRTVPNWHGATAGNPIHFVYDEQVPSTFYVYPPAATSSQLDISYSAVPAAVDINSNIALQDVYRTPLLYYTLFRAHSKDTEASSPERASAYYTMFTNAIGFKASGEQSTPLA